MEQQHTQQSNSSINGDSFLGSPKSNWGLNHEIEDIILNQQPKLGFFHMHTAGGKTNQALELITNILGNAFIGRTPTMYNQKLLYATSRVQEVLEGLMRLHNKLIEEKGPTHYKYYLDKLFVRFSKYSESYLIAISNIEDGLTKDSPFTSKDVKWLKSYIEDDVDAKYSKKALARLFKSRAIITTHKSFPVIATILGKSCADYSVFIDELPYNFISFSEIVKNDTFSKDIEALMNSNCKVEDIARASELSKQFKIGLLTATELNSTRIIHYNRNHPFKSIVIASASISEPSLVAKACGEGYITFIGSGLNEGLIEEGSKNYSFVKEDFKEGERVLNICTNASSKGLDNVILSNLTGVNSFSGFDKVRLHGNFRFPSSMKTRLADFFGEEEAVGIEFMMFRDRILQSLYRSAIRRGHFIKVFVSNERQERLVASIFER